MEVIKMKLYIVKTKNNYFVMTTKTDNSKLIKLLEDGKIKILSKQVLERRVVKLIR